MSAPAAAPHRTISQFCDHVCMYVRFRPDHEAITAELTAHLEDHKAAILETRPDMPLREAERRAVEAMGNPEGHPPQPMEPGAGAPGLAVGGGRPRQFLSLLSSGQAADRTRILHYGLW